MISAGPAAGGAGGESRKIAPAVLRVAIPVVALLAMLCALFPDVFFRGHVISSNDVLYGYPPFNRDAPGGHRQAHNFLLADQPHQFYASRAFLKQQVRQGVWPWWMPNILCGKSFVLDLPAQAFHPAQILNWIFPQTVGETANALLKLFAAGAGMFLFLRSRRIGTGAALAGGFGFMACSYNIVWLGHPHSSISALIPFALLLVERAFQGRDRPPVTIAAGGVLFFLAIAGGHPNTTILLLLMAGLFVVFRFLAGGPGETWRNRTRATATVAAALALGVMLSGIFLVPFIYARLSGEFSYGNRIGVAAWAQPLPPRGFLPLILPLAQGSPVTRDDHNVYNFNESSMFVGVLLLLPQIIALPWLLRRRDYLFLAGVSALVLVTLQDISPLATVVRNIPLLRDNHLQRMTLLLQTSLVAGGAIAWHVLASGFERKRNRMLIAALAILAIFIALISTRGLSHARGYEWFAIAIVSGGVIAALLPFVAGRALRAGLLASVCVLLACELRAAHGDYNPQLKRKTAAVKIPKAAGAVINEMTNGWFRISSIDGSFIPNSSAWLGLIDIRGYDQPIARRYIDFLTHALYGGKWPYDLCYWECGRIDIDDPGQRRILEVMGVRYCFVSGGDKLGVHTISGAMPHVFWASALQPSTGNIARDVALIREGGMVAILPPDETPPGGGAGRIVEHTINVNSIRIHVDAVRPVVLVLNEMFIRGWRARIDGRPARVFPVNVIQTGVRVEPGRHEIVFNFLPPGVKPGAILSCLGLVVLVALQVIRRRHAAKR